MLSVIGECLIDLVGAGDGRTFIAHPGGSPLNIAVGLARLGHPSALMARLADDAFGRVLRRYAMAADLDLSASPHALEPATLAVVSLDDEGRASYDFYVNQTADWQWTANELDAFPTDTTLLHTGSLAAWTPPGADLIAELCARLRKDDRILLSYDPNVRARLMGDRDSAHSRVEASVATAHVVKASDEDIAWLYPDQPASSVAARWLDLGPQLVVVTQGPHGATAYRHGEQPLHQAGRPIALVDTVGAGDAFMSGLLSSLVDHSINAPADLSALQDDALVAELLSRAVLVSALTCERAGANPPTRAETDLAQTV